MLNAKKVVGGLVIGMAALATGLLTPRVTLAHCDGWDGPVVLAAQKALAEENVNHALIWVQLGDDDAIKTAFQKTLAVRKLSPEARELADTYFFETLVRIHRAGEGAPYTGLKPAGRDLGPIIPAADKAIADGNVQPLLALLPVAAHADVQRHFQEALAKKQHSPDDVPAGRAYVAAYVAFVHAAAGSQEGDHEDADHHHHHEGHESSTHRTSAGCDIHAPAGAHPTASACPLHGSPQPTQGPATP